VRLVTGEDNAAFDRSRVKLVQTPQTFISSILLPAYAPGVEYREEFTDEATVAEAAGHTVRYYENIEGGHAGAADNAQTAFRSALIFEFLWRTIG